MNRPTLIQTWKKTLKNYPRLLLNLQSQDQPEAVPQQTIPQRNQKHLVVYHKFNITYSFIIQMTIFIKNRYHVHVHVFLK